MTSAALDEVPVSRAPSAGQHYATKKAQDGLTIYSTVLPLGAIARDIAKDFSPEEPLPGNRRVNAKRAFDYADYVVARHREGRQHITPPVILRCSPYEVKEVGRWIPEEAQGIARGTLELAPRAAGTADGQHRIYGVRKKLEWYDEQILAQQLRIEQAEENEEEPAVVEELQRTMERLQDERAALYNLPVTTEIILVTSERQYQQLFADIANNAKGLGGDLTTWFDQSKVAYRVARTLIEPEGHPLLVGKVHVGVGTEDRLAAESPYWIGAKTVADMVHAVAKGVGGRFSRRDEDEFERDPKLERSLDSDARRFLDCLTTAFPVLGEIQSGRPQFGGEVRKSKKTMLTSASMLRALAGAYHLTVYTNEIPLPGDDEEERVEAFTEGLKSLGDAMTVDPSVGLERNNLLVTLVPESFAFGGTSKPTAPTARQGNINALAKGIAQHIQKTQSQS